MFGVSPFTAAVASSPKLLDRVRWRLRVKHYSIRTEQAYGEKTIREQRPYIVKHVRDKWIIHGAPPPPGMAGGSFHIVISQRDGRVLEITHDV